MMRSLLRSRKILLLAFAVVQTLVSHYADLPPEVWASINALILGVIGSIALEDAAEKHSGGKLNVDTKTDTEDDGHQRH